MTNEQINAAIHAALGNPLGCPRCSDPECAYNCGINYCTDLNAMHEAENILQRMTFEFTQWLLEIVSRDDGPGTWYASGSFAHVHATARQRAEAFLRTLGKWEEAE